MALNKAQTSLLTKIVLIVIAMAFVVSFIPVMLPNGGTQQQPAQNPQAQTDAIAAQFAPTVQAMTRALESDPTSYTALVTLGNTYLDWAAALQSQAGAQGTQGADIPLWTSAREAYVKARAIKQGDREVDGNYAITLFSTGQTDQAIEVAEATVKQHPDFAPVWFNLGIFYEASGNNAKSVEAYKRYLELDPNGQQGDVARAKDAVARLSGASSAPATSTGN